MPLNAPTIQGTMRPGVWDERQAAGTKAEGYNPEISALIQQLPSYQAWVQSVQRRGPTGQGVGGTAEWNALMADIQRHGIPVPDDEVLDSQTGTVRGKTWTERHPVLAGVLTTAAFAGGGAALGAALGGAAGAAGAGSAGLGETAATTGLASGAGLPGAVAAPSLASAGLGEAAATTGLAGSGLGGSEAALAPLASSPTASIGALPAGLHSGTSAALSGVTLPSAGSTLGTIGKLARAGSDIGNAVSNAAAATGSNRRLDTQIGQNAQRTYEDALINRATEEDKQRSQALKDIYRSSYFKNEKPGPYDARGLAKVSPEYLSSLSDLEKQGMARLAASPTYDAAKFKPLVERTVPDASGLEQAGQWVGPTLSTIGTIAGYFK